MQQYDMFARPLPSFTLNGKEKVTSTPGLCLTFILGITMLIFAMSRLPFLIEKKNPLLSRFIDTDFYSNSDVISFKETANFNIAFTVVGYEDRLPRENSDYVWWDVFIKESIDGVQTRKPLKFDRCVEDDWKRFDAKPSDQKAFDRLKKKDVLFCLAPEEKQDHKLQIFGKDDTEDYRRLEMNLMACEDARQECTKTKQEMLDYLGPLDVVIVYTSTSLAARDFKDPISRSIKISNQQIDFEKPNFVHY